MKSIINRRKTTLIALAVSVLLVCGLIAAQPVQAASKIKKPTKVKNVKVATLYKARSVEFGDNSNGVIAPATIKWSKAVNAKSYQLAFKKAGAKTWNFRSVKSTSLRIQDYNVKSRNLKPGTRYAVKVRGINKSVKGKWSNIKYFTTRKIEYAQPGIISGLKVIERCEHSDGHSPIVLKWDKTDNAEKYELSYKTGRNEWESVFSDSNTAKAENLNPYCRYEFRVRAINGDKTGEWSEILTAYTRVNSLEIDFPTITNFRILHRGLGSLTLSWDADYSAYSSKKIIDNKHVKYNVYCSTDKENWTLVADHIRDTTYTQRFCDINVLYFFKVVPADNESYKEFDYNGEQSEIISGKVQDIGVDVVKKYTTENSDYILNRSFNFRGLMLHSVGGNIENAEDWIRIYDNYDAPASVHGFIDGTTGVLFQTFDWMMRGGHAGPAGNNRYVGIEMCESRYLRYSSDQVTFDVEEGHEDDARAVAERTYNTAVKLFAFLCDYFGFDPLEKGNIVSHYEWGTEYRDMSGGGHQDPEHMWTQLNTGYTMDGFRQDVKEMMDLYCK